MFDISRHHPFGPVPGLNKIMPDGCINLENDDRERDLNKGYCAEAVLTSRKSSFVDGEIVNGS